MGRAQIYGCAPFVDEGHASSYHFSGHSPWAGMGEKERWKKEGRKRKEEIEEVLEKSKGKKMCEEKEKMEQ